MRQQREETEREIGECASYLRKTYFTLAEEEEEEESGGVPSIGTLHYKEEEQKRAMMEESALDVLSRAATMLQEQSPIHLANDESKLNSKQLPSTKWKRDRRNNAQYGRKSIAGQPPKPNNDPQQSSAADESRLDDGGRDPTAVAAEAADDSPLDMSVRQRGLPPSYSQAINDPSFRSTYKATTSPDGPSSCVGNGVPVASGNRDDLPSGISMCDPIIDEHFRRSLGKAYMTVFNNGNGQQPQQITSSAASTNKTSFPPIPNNAQSRLKATTTAVTSTNNNNNNLLKSPPPPPDDSVVSIANKEGGTNGGTAASRRATAVASSTANVSDLMDGEGLSVDDHFAKALGDTWLKLNGKKDAVTTSVKTQNTVVESGSANSLVSI